MSITRMSAAQVVALAKLVEEQEWDTDLAIHSESWATNVMAVVNGEDWWIARNGEVQAPDSYVWRKQAYERGVEAAKAAASWVADGNSDAAGIGRLLAMLEDGDPEAYDRLPRYPDLSGEWADDPTPLSLAREITGDEDVDPDLVDALATAWEEGVQETFETACEAELRSHL